MTMIAIVDDDESVREATKSLVRSLGYEAATFCSAEEFLDSAQLETTACLITDVRMPGMSGVELLDRLIAEGRGLPTVFISAFSDEGVRKKVLESGAVGYLRKPFEESRLIACIGRALNEQSADR